jgi:hypothetical protein
VGLGSYYRSSPLSLFKVCDGVHIIGHLLCLCLRCGIGVIL